VYAEPSTVDVLIHHRDTRAMPAKDAYTSLFYRTAPTALELLGSPAAAFNVLSTWNGANTVPIPTGWTLVQQKLADGSFTSLHQLPVALDAFMPRAISIDVDLTGKTGYVLLFAVCGDSAEDPSPWPSTAPTVSDLVKAWPRAAMRLVKVLGKRK
jgi:hypothetical protein